MLQTLLTMDPVVILSFMTAGILLNLTPGADVVFVTASGISGGWRNGVAASMGIALGSISHVVLAAIGVSAAIMALPWAYDAIRYAGAAYLVFLAIKAWRSDGDVGEGQGAHSVTQALKRGFLTNLLNPKVALFVLAFLPQFTRLEVGPVWQQILILGAIFVATGLVVTSSFGIAAGVFGTTIRRASGTLNKLTAIVFGGLAARLMWD